VIRDTKKGSANKGHAMLTCLAIALLLNIMWLIQVVLEPFAYVKLLPVSEATFQLGK